jgi:calcineurin-like phosphoesterase family protein
MSKIFLTSDTHFGHDREFLWGPRGFKSSREHDEAVIANWNSVVGPDDDVYVLGDLMLGDNEWGVECVRRLNGRIFLIRGNHDTDKRWYEVYRNISNKVFIGGWAEVIHYRKYHFYLSHFPTNTANIEAESLHQCTLNLFGHTHSKEQFREDYPMYYNVALDANDNTPVLLDDIIDRMKAKVQECISYL